MVNTLEIEPSAIEMDWHSRGFSCGIWIDHSGHAWIDDLYDTDKLFMAISGELEIEIAGRRIRPRIGEEILMSASVPHAVRNVGNRTARWLYGQRSPSSNFPSTL